MKRGVVERDFDVSGVSGTGSVAEFCISSDGRVVIFWKVGKSEFPTLEDAIKVHGHGGNTRFVILDDEAANEDKHCVDCHFVMNNDNLKCLEHDACPGCLVAV